MRLRVGDGGRDGEDGEGWLVGSGGDDGMTYGSSIPASILLTEVTR